jgi:Histidine kinase
MVGKLTSKATSNADISIWLIHHRWLWHLGFWLLYALSRVFRYYLTVAYYDSRLLWFMVGMELTFIPVVYGTLWLYRRFCYTGRFKVYFLIGLPIWTGYVVFFAQSVLFWVGDMEHLKGTRWQDIFYNNLTGYLFTFLALTAAKYVKDSFIHQYHESQRRQLQLATELENLKAQISPHFLFNTMNNFYGLAVARSEKLPGLMVRMCELLRYALYETQHATVPLTRDVSNLQAYIELEKIRLEDDLDFQFEHNIPDGCTAVIAPLLLIVFVENAFKHAKKVQNEPIQIAVQLKLLDNGSLFFEVRNNCAPTTGNPKTTTGIGLENVKKRLDVLYPDGGYQLIFEKPAGFFVAKLTLQRAIYTA